MEGIAPFRTMLPRVASAICCLALVALRPGSASPGSPPAAGGAPPLLVEHATPRAVYLGSGSLSGLGVGDRLEVVRDGRPVALIEVVRITEHSAFCSLLHEFLPIEPGDVAIASSYEELTVTDAPEPLPPPEAPSRLPRLAERRRRASEIRRQALSGTVLLRAQSRTLDDGGRSRGWQESTARLSLAGRNLGGRPITLRVRGRGRQRSRDRGDEPSEIDRRLYELSLRWEPTGSRSWWQAGRIGSRQEVGSGYLDGLVGQLGIGRRWGLGGFAGLNPQARDDLFSTSATKAGLFASFSTPRGPRRYAEVLLSAIGEYVPAGIDREYLFLQTRLGDRGRWSLYQQAELDLNRGWRSEAAGGGTELSNLSLAASVRLSERFRASLSYDARRRYRDDDTRDVPEESFDRLLREGYRTTIYFRGGGGLSLSAGVGLRGGEGDVDTVDSLVLSANHGSAFGWRLLVGGDYSTFRSDTGSGFLATLRARKGLRGGHDVGFTLGQSRSTSRRSLSTGEIATDELELSWLRVDGTLQLPRGLYLLGEVELGLSEQAETRHTLQLGVRF